ncbi:MAG TPA: TIGR03118 family protein [Bryobacteraceae bacterium]|nr:TIGR03118 family protein [Bryobacteraceae bacterium]
MHLNEKPVYSAWALALALLAPQAFAATNFVQTNLVADVAGVAAVTDPNLVGCWGMSASASSPLWVSNTATGTSTLYTVTEAAPTVPVVNSLVAVIPPSAKNKGKTGLPTGQVNNSYGAGNFEVVAGHPASFMFATYDGTISGWYGGVANNTAIPFVDHSANAAAYTGLAIGVSSIGPTLYATNFSNGTIDTFDHTLKQVTMPGGFQDLDLPNSYFPFNIQRFGRRLYVSFAYSDSTGSLAFGGPGTGLIDVFDLNGNLLQHLVPNNAHLNLPWGMAVTGANFGSFSYALIVGNFGDGTISAFDLDTGNYLGTMQDGHGNNIAIDGLWALQWGNGGSGGDPGTLYFNAAPSQGQHGLFGSLKPASDSTLQ